MEKNIKNIMVAFVSLVNERSLKSPIRYEDIGGSPYEAIQTNEAAVVWLARKFRRNPLDRLFLIASQTVAEGKVPGGGEAGQVTHRDFLERRLLQELPELAGKFRYFKYTDDGEGSLDEALGKNLLEVAEIARGIQAYREEHPQERVVVHADMTGGMRHASMMMLSIMQLLKYEGVEIGTVLYADPIGRRVYEATNIQRMFTLINGADEFVKFGSVKAIEEYFEPYGESVSPPLQELLQAMGRFSDAIKLCRTGIILEEVRNLGQKLKAFQTAGGTSLQEKLFSQLIKAIEKEYGPLLQPEVKRTDIIRWCMGKEFWQQALTLCTEWIPELLVDEKIAYTDRGDVKEFCAYEGERMSRSWKQHFIMAYNGGASAGSPYGVKQLRQWVFDHAEEAGLAEEAVRQELAAYPKFQKLMLEYMGGREIYEGIQSGCRMVKDLRESYPEVMKLLEVIYNERKNCKNYSKSFTSFIYSLPYASLLNCAKNLPAAFYGQFLEQEEAKVQRVKPVGEKPQIRGSEKWENRSDQYWQLYRAGELKTKLESGREMLEFLHGYNEMKEMRNQINHAARGEEMLIEEVEEKIRLYIDRIENAAAQMHRQKAGQGERA